MSDIAIVNSTFGVVSTGTPVGPLSLTAALEQAGYSVEFHDYQTNRRLRKPAVKQFLDYLGRADSRVLGISTMCSTLPTVLGAVRELKAVQPDRYVILGGPAATDTPEAILRHFPIDVIVRGEGEESAVELMRALKEGRDLAEVRGISFRQHGRIVHNPARPRITNLDALPFPAYHKINFDDYERTAIVLTSRGCPYDCSFCSAHSVWQRRMTYRSARSVAEEILSIQSAVERVELWDDTFVLQPRRAVELVDEFERMRFALPWTCGGRINLMTTGLLKRLGAGGCVALYYGVESGNDRVLEQIHKGFTAEQAARTIQESTLYIPHVYTSYIWGFPFETTDDFYDTLLMLTSDMRDPKITALLTLLTPLAASPLRQTFADRLRFSLDYQMGASTLPADDLRNYPELVELIRTYPELFSSFYYIDHEAVQEKKAIVERLVEQARRQRGANQGRAERHPIPNATPL